MKKFIFRQSCWAAHDKLENMNPDYQKRINRVVDLIRKAPQKQYSLSDLAEISCFSPFHFHRLFSAYMNETPADYIRRTRIERSLNFLFHNRRSSITEIGLDSGFSSSANFSKAFRTVTGYTPRQCRNMSYEELVEKIGARVRRKSDLEHKKWEQILKQTIMQERNECAVIYLRYFGPYDFRLGLHWIRFSRILKARNYLSENPELFGISYDNPDLIPAGMNMYDACAVVDRMQNDPQLSCMMIPAAQYAVFSYKGLPAGINDLFTVIYAKWIPENNFEPANQPVLQRIRRIPRGPVLDLEIMVPVLR
ncbi:MAG: AraC family transcriptional regulator [Spirochaetales bacterium]|nr:AraC family transcriptional regulator [Spirochaetales bacterium]